MTSFAEIIAAFGSATQFAVAVGIPPSHARTMKARDSIPASRWLAVAAAAKQHGIEGVTIEAMASIEAQRAGQ